MTKDELYEIAKLLPEADKRELIGKLGGAHTNDDSGGNSPPPPPPTVGG